MKLLRLLTLLSLLALAGCATITKVERGEVVVAERLVVHLDGPWNQFEGGAAGGAPTWTVEGFTVDRLQFYVGIKDGAVIAQAPRGDKEQRPLTFRASMEPHEVVALYQNLLTADGSTFTLDRLEPAEFLGGKGFRFHFSMVRKVDEVRLSGIAYGAVRGNELFVIMYSAPRLAFFPRYQSQIEAMARSARLRS